MVEEYKPDRTLDVRGLYCPQPVLRAKKAMDEMKAGEILEVLGTDPGSKVDLPAWVRRTGNEFLGAKEEKDCNRYLIRKKK